MALIELKLNPTSGDLKWFGVLAFLFFAVIGSIVYFASGFNVAAIVLWSVGTAFGLVYYAVRPAQIVLYRGWLKLFHPLGWVIAHVLFGVIYFVAFTLIGLALRLVGYDPLQLRRPRGAVTYWAEHGAETDSSRYFRQF